MEDKEFDDLMNRVDRVINYLEKDEGPYVEATSTEVKRKDGTNMFFTWEYDDDESLARLAYGECMRVNTARGAESYGLAKETYTFEVSKKIDDVQNLNGDKEYMLLSKVPFHKLYSGKQLYKKEWEKVPGNKVAANVRAIIAVGGEYLVFDLADDFYQDIKNDTMDKIRKREEYLFRRQKLQGDIIITDPCYVCRKIDSSDRPQWSDYHPYSSIIEYPDYDEEKKTSKMFDENMARMEAADDKWEEEHPNDWDDFEGAMKREGIECIMHRTLVGDWSCVTLDSEGNVLGNFCADSGEVGVFPLDAIRKYNSKFDESYISRGFATVIEDFDGEVWFKKIDNETLIVNGCGTSKGNPIEFSTKQVGF